MAEDNKKESSAAPADASVVAAVAVAPAPVEQVSISAPPLPAGVLFVWGTGRRKTAVARVRIRPGTGKFTVNDREKDAYFVDIRDQIAASLPLVAASMVKSWDIFVNVNGGGSCGQAGAVCMGLARALIKAAPDVEQAMRDQGLLTRDARMKERKKYGQKGARKRFQFSKR
jgi:small subunit ribosomal protein S9